MSDLKVNTDIAVSCATNLSTINGRIRDGIEEAQSAMSRLKGAWESSSSDAAIRKFYDIKTNYSEARYNVLDNYSKYILQQVGEGFDQTEEANTSLADAFK